MYTHNNFEGAELTLYTEGEQTICLSLDALEVAVMLKAIGFKMTTPNTYSHFGSAALTQILKGEINPFDLQERRKKYTVYHTEHSSKDGDSLTTAHSFDNLSDALTHKQAWDNWDAASKEEPTAYIVEEDN